MTCSIAAALSSQDDNLKLSVNLLEDFVQSSHRASDALEQCLLLFFMRICVSEWYRLVDLLALHEDGRTKRSNGSRLLCMRRAVQKSPGALC